MDFGSEKERRVEALRLVREEGLSVGDAAARVGRSRQWLSKWLGRDRAGDGLEDRSRAPLHSPNVLSDAIVARVLEERDRLEADLVASVGGLAILAELEQARFRPLPSLRSIERILSRHGRVKQRKRKRSRSTVPVLPLPVIDPVPGIWQQADWVQDRYLVGGFRYNSIQLVDVGCQVVASRQYQQRSLVNAIRFLLGNAWPIASIPQALSVDNSFAATTHRNNPWTVFTRFCLFLGVEVVVSPPYELGWTNHVENINNLWQDRTIARHQFETLDQLHAATDQFTDWANHRRPILDPSVYGTRYPAVAIDQHPNQLRQPPGIDLDDHLDPAGNLHIPLANGRVTFLRRVHNRHITIAHHQWPIDLPDHALVVASITTADTALTLRHQATTITTHHYPVQHHITKAYYPPTPHSIYHHA